jgi:hypothetical protein
MTCFPGLVNSALLFCLCSVAYRNFYPLSFASVPISYFHFLMASVTACYYYSSSDVRLQMRLMRMNLNHLPSLHHNHHDHCLSERVHLRSILHRQATGYQSVLGPSSVHYTLKIDCKTLYYY